MTKVKRILTVLLTAAIAAAYMVMPVYAAPSPGGDVVYTDDDANHLEIEEPGKTVIKTTMKANGNVEVESVEDETGIKYVLIVTPYQNYPTIADGKARADSPIAFTDITSYPVVSDYLPMIRPKARAIEVQPEDCFVYDVFDVTFYLDEGFRLTKSDNHGLVTLNLPWYVLDRFVCLLHYMDGEWSMVESARADKEKGLLHFSVRDFSPFAIIIHDNEEVPSSKRSPQTGYSIFDEFRFTIEERMKDLCD